MGGSAVGQVHAEEDEEGAEEEVDGDLLGEDEPGKDYGGNGIKVDIVSGHDGSQFLHHPVPGQEAEHRGDTAEEEQIDDDGRWQMEDGLESEYLGFARHEEEIGNHREEAVDEDLAGDEHRVVLGIGGNHEQRVDTPAEGGRESQRVA